MCTSIALEKTLSPQKFIECKSCKDDIILLLLFNAFYRPEHFSFWSRLSISQLNHAEICIELWTLDSCLASAAKSLLTLQYIIEVYFILSSSFC